MEEGVDDDNNGIIDDFYGANFITHTGIIRAENHGTHVAGIVAATNNNAMVQNCRRKWERDRHTAYDMPDNGRIQQHRRLRHQICCRQRGCHMPKQLGL